VIVSDALVVTNKHWPVTVRHKSTVSGLVKNADRTLPRARLRYAVLSGHTHQIAAKDEAITYGANGLIKRNLPKGLALDLFA
jgi:ribosome-interacting GTPase 1